MSAPVPCRSFPGEDCLLPAGPAGCWNCCMCRHVVDWLHGPFDTVYVQDCSTRKAVVSLFPARQEDPAPEGCVVAVHASTHTLNEIRILLSSVVDISDEIWIHEDEPAPHSRRQKP